MGDNLLISNLGATFRVWASAPEEVVPMGLEQGEMGATWKVGFTSMEGGQWAALSSSSGMGDYLTRHMHKTVGRKYTAFNKAFVQQAVFLRY
jgi:hypothetical protein